MTINFPIARTVRRIATVAVVGCAALLAGCVVAPPQAYQVGAPVVYGAPAYAAPAYVAPAYGYAYPAPSVSLGLSFGGGWGGHGYRGRGWHGRGWGHR